MKLKYLGTAAAEAWPAVWCNCDACKKARELKGKNIRTRSQAIINDDLLIDLPCDTYKHVLDNGIDLSAIKTLIVTHSHCDHFYPAELTFRGSYSGHNLTTPKLEIYGNDAVYERFKQGCERTYMNDEVKSGINFNIVEWFKPFLSGKYKITPLESQHSPIEKAVIYLIESEGKAMIYGHDSFEFPDSVINYLKDNNIKLDFVTYDCTMVLGRYQRGHMGLDNVVTTKENLEKNGLTKPTTIHYVNHFSHNGKLLHEEIVKEAEKYGINVSYDGCIVEF